MSKSVFSISIREMENNANLLFPHYSRTISKLNKFKKNPIFLFIDRRGLGFPGLEMEIEQSLRWITLFQYRSSSLSCFWELRFIHSYVLK